MITSDTKLSKNNICDIIIKTDKYIFEYNNDADIKLKSFVNKIQKLNLIKKINNLQLDFLVNELSYGYSLSGCRGWICGNSIFYDNDYDTEKNPLFILLIDLTKIANEFPYIKAVVTLFDSSCYDEDAKILGSFLVKNQIVTEIEETDIEILHKRPRIVRTKNVYETLCNIHSNIIPCSLSEQQFKELYEYIYTKYISNKYINTIT